MAFTEYQTSPLGVAFQNGIDKLQQIKSKYPHVIARPANVEEQYSATAILAIEDLLSVIHTVLLPKYSKGGNIGITDARKIIMGNELKQYTHLEKIPIIVAKPNYAAFAQIKLMLADFMLENIKNPNLKTLMLKQIQEKFSVYYGNSMLPQAQFKLIFDEIKNAVSEKELNPAQLNEKKNITQWLDELEDSLSPNEMIKTDAPFEFSIPTLKKALDSSDGKLELYITHPMSLEVLETLLDIINNTPEELYELVPFFNPKSLEKLDCFKFPGTASFFKRLIGMALQIKSISTAKDFVFTVYKEQDDKKETATVEASTIYKTMKPMVAAKIEHLINAHKQKQEFIRALTKQLSDSITQEIDENMQQMQTITVDDSKEPISLIKQLNAGISTVSQLIAANTEMLASLKTKQTCSISKLTPPSLEDQYNQCGIIECPSAFPELQAFDTFLKDKIVEVTTNNSNLNVTFKSLKDQRIQAVQKWVNTQVDKNKDQLESKKQELATILDKKLEGNASNKKEELEQSLELINVQISEIIVLQKASSELTAAIEAQTMLQEFDQLTQDTLKGPLTEGQQQIITASNKFTEALQLQVTQLQKQLVKTEKELETLKMSNSANPAMLRACLADNKAQEAKRTALLQRAEEIKAQQDLLSDPDSQAEFQKDIQVLDHLLLTKVTEGMAKLDKKFKVDNLDAALQVFNNHITNITQEIAKSKIKVGAKAPVHNVSEQLAFLQEVNRLLLKAAGGKTIPFKAVNKLPLAEKLAAKDQSGFGYLLSLVGITESQELKSWEQHRADQDGVLPMLRKDTRFVQKSAELANAIAAKTQELLELQKFNQLSSLAAEIAPYEAVLNDAQERRKIKRIQETKDQLAKDQLAQEMATITEQLSELPQNSEKAKTDEIAFPLLCDLLEQKDALVAHIDKLGNLNLLADNTTAALVELPALYQQLSNLLDSTKRSITQLPTADQYQDLLRTADELITMAKTSLKDKIKEAWDNTTIVTLAEKVKLADLINSLNALDASDNKGASLTTLLESYAEFAQAAEQFAEAVNSAAPNVEIIPLTLDDGYKAAMKTYQTALEALPEQRQAFEEALKTSLRNLYGMNSQLQDIKFAETQASHDAALLKLEEITVALAALPGLEMIKPHLSQFPDADNFLTELTSLREATESAVAHAKINVEAIPGRINVRANTITAVLGQLEAYAAGHKNTAENNEFFTQLKEQLALYKDGEAANVIELIHAQKNLPNETALYSLLNRIIMAVKESQREVPADYTVPKAVLSGNVDEILAKLQSNNPLYVNKIKDLYVKIEDIRQFGTDLKKTNPNISSAATGLADKLNDDLNRFVLSSPDQVPTAEAYSAFKTDFNTRLHTEDDKMINQPGWFTKLGNAFLVLVSLGTIYLADKLYSKIKENGSLFFSAPPTAEEKLKALALTDENGPLSIKQGPGPASAA